MRLWCASSLLSTSYDLQTPATCNIRSREVFARVRSASPFAAVVTFRVLSTAPRCAQFEVQYNPDARLAYTPSNVTGRAAEENLNKNGDFAKSVSRSLFCYRSAVYPVARHFGVYPLTISVFWTSPCTVPLSPYVRSWTHTAQVLHSPRCV